MFHFNRTSLRGAQFTAQSNASARCGRPSIVAPLLVLILLAFIAPQAVNSQVLYGSLTGTVNDQKGAAVPGVNVEARNVGTAITREAITDESGGYQFSGLQPGTYNVTFAFASFKTLIQQNVKIEANTVGRADAELQVADSKATLAVTPERAA